MNDINELLKLIINLSWFFHVITMLTFYYVVKKSRHSLSSLISMIVFTALNTLMIGYQEVLHYCIEINFGSEFLINLFWYMGFAILEIIGIWAIIFVHKKENLMIGRLGQFLALVFFLRCTLQVLQYSEILLLNTNSELWNIYMVGIPTMNISISIVSFSIACLAMYYSYFSRKGMKGLEKWAI